MINSVVCLLQERTAVTSDSDGHPVHTSRGINLEYNILFLSVNHRDIFQIIFTKTANGLQLQPSARIRFSNNLIKDTGFLQPSQLGKLGQTVKSVGINS